ncbi:arabinosyltransferase ARAD1, partial [Populus alba x Populus x berolinensis]
SNCQSHKPGQVFLEKDLILACVPNVSLCDAKSTSESESKRTTLLFFRGRLKRNAGGKIRAKLVAEPRGADGRGGDSWRGRESRSSSWHAGL